jgi:hypothetical protein
MQGLERQLRQKTAHLAAVNSKALEMAGIDEHTPDPEGGVFQRWSRLCPMRNASSVRSITVEQEEPRPMDGRVGGQRLVPLLASSPTQNP